MPPLYGPRMLLCWTRYPLNRRYSPLSMRTGKLTISSFLGWDRMLLIEDGRPQISAARVSWSWAILYGFGFWSVMVTVDPMPPERRTAEILRALRPPRPSRASHRLLG